MCQQRLSQCDDALLGTDAAAFKHDKVVADLTIEWEATHWCDGLLGDVVLGRGVVLDDLSVLGVDASSDTVDLLVDLGTVVVTLLTGTSDGEGDTTWMPCSDTSDLTKTLVCLAWQFLCVPTASDTLETFSLGDGDAVNHLVLSKDLRDWNGLFQVLLDPLDLVLNGTAIQLDFHDVGLLLALLDQADLRMDDDADVLAVADHFLKVVLDGLLAEIIGPLLAGLCESLLLARVPVLVETTTALFGQMLGPDIAEGTWSMWSFDITNGTDDDNWWGLENGYSFDDFLLVDL